MIQKLLVATASDARGADVEAAALELARALGARVVLLHVIEAIEADGDAETRAFYEGLRSKAEARLAEVCARFQADGVTAAAQVVVGRRWQTIVERAEAEDVDLIVIGSRPTVDAEGKPQLGSTSHRVFFAAARPLFVVRERGARA